MKLFSAKSLRWVLTGLIVLVVVGVGVAAMPLVKNWAGQGKGRDEDTAAQDNPSIKLVSNDPVTVQVAPAAVRSLVMDTAVVERAKELRPLHLFGQLAPDTDRLIRIKPRFAGQVASVTKIQAQENGRTVIRPLRMGDHVEKGQVLAVLYSQPLGQAKSTLVDSWSKLLTDRRYLEELRKSNSVPWKTLQDAQRAVDADQIQVDAAERTLRAWEIPDEDIRALKAEGKRGGDTGAKQWEKWATYEVKAPTRFDGMIVQKDCTEGENIDPSTSPPPLFQIADFSRLTVFAYPYEEDLPLIRSLGAHTPWTIIPKADPTVRLEGTVDTVLPILEANQKTPILRGYVNNPNRELLSNMSVTATIDVPAPEGEVVVPATALVDDGNESVVFVQPDPNKQEFVLQHVQVVRRYADRVYLRQKPGSDKMKPLHPGQRVLKSGAVELKAALDDLNSPSPTQ